MRSSYFHISWIHPGNNGPLDSHGCLRDSVATFGQVIRYPVVRKRKADRFQSGGKTMFLDIFDFDGDGELNAVEMAVAYTVMFGEDTWDKAESEQYEDPKEDDFLPDPEDSYSDNEYGF